MTMWKRLIIVTWALLLVEAGSAAAQSGSSGTSTGQSPSAATPSSSAASAETRPATTTFYGDTGLWFVPTAEVLAHGKWSVSGYRRGTNYVQGFTNVGDFAGTFAVGIKDRAEVFASFLVDTRIDRDIRPIFIPDRRVGGIVDRYPGVSSGWTGDNIGDLFVGAKVNLWSEYRQQPAALAVRGILKLPTGKDDVGVSTGKTDFLIDFIASKEASRIVELSGYAGYEVRGKPDGLDAPGGAFRAVAGLPIETPALAVNRLCGSGFEAVVQAAMLLATGQAEAVLAGGTESMSEAPLVVRGTRFGHSFLSPPPVEDMLGNSLTDSYAGMAMALTAEKLAEQYRITRAEVDEYSALSQKRFASAQQAGRLAAEIAPIDVPGKKGPVRFERDEHPRPETTVEALAKLRPIFKKDGVIHAGAASGIADGAGALVLCTRAFAEKRGLRPLARLVNWGTAGVEPSVVLSKVDESTDRAFGYNAATRTYGDLLQMGVIDPAKVTRLALQNAGSISGLILTVDCLIANAPKPKQGAGEGAMHGAEPPEF